MPRVEDLPTSCDEELGARVAVLARRITALEATQRELIVRVAKLEEAAATAATATIAAAVAEDNQ